MIFTFYSYKGGVGRSMAVAGCAYLLARHGLKVLVVDFDLEAPGLERYFFDTERSRWAREQRGLLDLIQSYRRALTDESAFDAGAFKQWDRYVIPAVHAAGQSGGRVDLMTAGQRGPDERIRDYAQAVRGFDWQDFFHNWKGNLFFDWLRRRLTEPGEGYDVVIVDSRTGVTEMGGVCAYQLADAVVLLCAPNYQNLEGTADVLRDFRSDGVMALRNGRPLEIMVVPARLAPEHPRREEFLSVFAETLGVEGLPRRLAEAALSYRRLALPYRPANAVEEQVVGSSSEMFATLADALVLLAPQGSALEGQRGAALARLRGEDAGAPDLLADPTRATAGYDVVIDCAAADREAAGALRDALEGAGLRTFFDDSGVDAGATFTEVIERALDYGRVLAVCIGEGVGGEWRSQLLALARRRKHLSIVPVLLPGADVQALRALDLAEIQALDLRMDASGTALQAWARGLPQPGRPPASARSAIDAQRDPYPGPAPYGEDDRGFFVGREFELDVLYDVWQRHDVVLLSGPAQIGKSSLLRAGLLPRMRAAAAQEAGRVDPAVAYVDYADGEPDWPALTQRPDHGPAFYAILDWSVRTVVVDSIDSFDAGGTEDQRAQRIAALQHAIAHAGRGFKFVLCWRDVLPWAERQAALEGLVGNRTFTEIALRPMEGASLARAIEEPARRAGHLLEAGCVERLIESAGLAANALAQIQWTLAAAWPERRLGWLSHKNLDAVGHLMGVFDRRRAAVLGALAKPEAAVAAALLNRLVGIGTHFEIVPVAQGWSELATMPMLASADAVALRDRLAGAGLIELGRAAAQDGRVAVQIALARPDAPAYLEALDTALYRRDLLWRGQLGASVRDWEQTERSDAALLRGGLLEEAVQRRADSGDRLLEGERALIEASVRAAEVERQQQRVVLARLKRGVRVASVATALAVVMGITALYFYWQADRARVAVNAQRLAAHSTAILGGAIDGSTEQMLLQLVAAHQTGPGESVYAAMVQAALKTSHLKLLIPANRTSGAVAFSPDGTRIATGHAYGVVRLWDARTGQPVGSPFSGHTGLVTSVAFSRDGSRIVSGSRDATIRLWDARTGQPIGSALKGHEENVTSVAFSPDGTRVVSGSWDSTLRLWDANTGEPIGSPLSEGYGEVRSVAFSPDGARIVSGSNDDTLRLWDAHTGKPIGSPLTGHGDTVTSVAFSPDGTRIVSGSLDKTLRLWDASTGLPIGSPLTGHEGDVTSVAFSVDGSRIVSGSQDKTLRLWDAQTGQPIGSPLSGLGAVIRRVAFSPDGARIVSGSSDWMLRMWDARTGQGPDAPLAGHVGAVSSVAFSPDGTRIVSGSWDKTLRLWDARTVQPIGSPLSGHTGWIGSVAYSADGSRIVSGSSDKTLRLWDARTGESIGSPLTGHSAEVNSVAFSPDGSRIVSSSSDKSLRLWDAHTGQAIGAPLTGHSGVVNGVAFSPDGSRLVSGSRDKTLRLWDAGTGQPIGSPLVGHDADVMEVAFSPDGTRIVSGSEDKTLRLWDARTGQPIGPPLIGHDSYVNSVTFSPDGARVVSGSSDNTLRVWNARTGQPIGSVLSGHTSAVISIAFSPDGTRIVSGSQDTTLRLWPSDFKAWPATLCSKLTRNPSPAEWRLWIGADIRYPSPPPCPGLPVTQDAPDLGAGAAAAPAR